MLKFILQTFVRAFLFRATQQLCVLQAMQQFGIRLAELQSALGRDRETLTVLNIALQQAGATSEVASSVRYVARLLSETENINCQVLFFSIKFNILSDRLIVIIVKLA